MTKEKLAAYSKKKGRKIIKNETTQIAQQLEAI